MTLSNFFALNVDPSKAIPGSYNFALVLLSESITPLQVAGGLLIGGGILLARRRRVTPAGA